MRRRGTSLMSKADSADERLRKMSPENKDLRQQIDLLVDLRGQIRTVNVEIVDEEASLGAGIGSRGRNGSSPSGPLLWSLAGGTPPHGGRTKTPKSP